MELIINVLLYLVPTFGIGVILRQDGQLKLIMAVISLAASLIGEVTFLASSGVYGPIASVDFWKTVGTFYLMAVFPLGLWAAMFAGAGLETAQTKLTQIKNRRVLLSFLGSVVGVLIGGVFMFIYSQLIFLMESATVPPDALPYTLSGLVAGGFSGFYCGLVMTRGQTRGQTRLC